MFDAPDRSALLAAAASPYRVARSGRADAEVAIAMLGARARQQAPTETLLHFGQWLDWPDWLRGGTSLTGSGPLPPTVSLGDGLIIIGNILDHADFHALVERMLTSPRPVVGAVASLQLLHAPDMGTALTSLVDAVATPNPWLLCWFSQDQDIADISLLPPWPMGPLFEFAALAGAALFYRAIEATYCKDLADMVLETRFHDEPRVQGLLKAFRCRIAPSTGAERLRFPSAWLATPNPHYDPMLWDVARAKLGTLMAETGEPPSLARMRAFIVDMLERERRVPRLKQAAAHLGMSTRTIVRMLGRHGTSFHKLVEEQRKARALVLISDPSLPLADVAQALGFSDMSSFGRSFRGWFGHTPGHLRQSGSERPRAPHPGAHAAGPAVPDAFQLRHAIAEKPAQ
jgi:AraC-like DNA-binding protein